MSVVFQAVAARLGRGIFYTGALTVEAVLTLARSRGCVDPLGAEAGFAADRVRLDPSVTPTFTFVAEAKNLDVNERGLKGGSGRLVTIEAEEGCAYVAQDRVVLAGIMRYLNSLRAEHPRVADFFASVPCAVTLYSAASSEEVNELLESSVRLARIERRTKVPA